MLYPWCKVETRRQGPKSEGFRRWRDWEGGCARSEPPISRIADSPSTNDGPDHACVLEAHAAPPAPPPSTHRPIVRASAPQRYRVQFTIDQASHDKLRRVQALLRREIPNGDTGVIFVRALDLFVETVEKAKLGAPARPPRTKDGRRPGSIYETRIRFETDERAVDSESRTDAGGGQAPGEQGKIVHRQERTRHISKAVRRVVWRRDGGRCAFVSSAGRRCTERTFLEFHHVQPYAMDGPATVGTSPFAAGDTTNTRPRWCSDRRVPRWCAKRRRSIGAVFARAEIGSSGRPALAMRRARGTWRR
jgi:hypothetical protein